MRRFILFLAAFAATQVQAAHWVIVRDDAVRPPQLGTYVSAARTAAQSARSAFTTLALSNLHYVTLADAPDLDAAKAFSRAWIDPAAVESRAVAIWELRPDLSYEPAEPRLMAGEEGFIHFDVYASLPGHDGEVEALTREYAEVDRKAGVRHRWIVYAVVIGADLPAFVVATPARARDDYESEKKAADLLRAGRDLPLHIRNTQLLRRVDSFEGVIRRDLSHGAARETK